MYGKIRAEALRLLETGAISRRGRPLADPEEGAIARELRAMKLAYKNMPSDFRREWDAQLALAPFPDIHAWLRTENAEARAYERGAKRLEAENDMTADPAERLNEVRRMAVLPAQQVRQDDRKRRKGVVACVVDALETIGVKVNAKTVARELERRTGSPCEVKPDTLRKYIREIRRVRHKE